MEDIARQMGVAKSTVSKALRGDRRISAAMRERIAAAAEKLGYRKNPLVAALMAGLRRGRLRDMTPVIAFLMPTNSRADWLASRAYAEFLAGARDRAEALGFQLEEFVLSEYAMNIDRVADVLRARGIQGVVVGPQKYLQAAMSGDWPGFWRRFALALLSFSFPEAPMHRASNHIYLSMLNGLNQLSRKGYTRVAVVDHEAMDLRHVRQISGAAAAHAANRPRGARVPPLLANPLTEETFLRWFKKYRPDAILTGEPLVPVWLRSIGLSIPRDIAYAEMNTHAERGIAGIDQHLENVGAAATDLVARQLYQNETGLPPQPHLVLVAGHWVDGPTAPDKPSARRAS